MASEFPFLAGALFKWCRMDQPQTIQGRVFLLIESENSDQAIEMREQMAIKPELFIELLTTMRPWHPEIITVNNEELNKHTEIKEIFPYHSGLDE